MINERSGVFKVDLFSGWMLFFVFPMLKQWNLERLRVGTIRSLEKKRGSR